MTRQTCLRCRTAPRSPHRTKYCDPCAAASLTESRRAAHRRHEARRQKGRRLDASRRPCSECPGTIPGHHRRSRLTCSDPCWRARRRRVARELEAARRANRPRGRICVVCSRTYHSSHAQKITCSAECSAERKRQTARDYYWEKARHVRRAAQKKRTTRRAPARQRLPHDGYDAVQAYQRMRATNPDLARAYLRSLNTQRRLAGLPEVPA